MIMTHRMHHVAGFKKGKTKQATFRVTAISVISTQCRIYLDVPPAKSAEGREGTKKGNPAMVSFNDYQCDGQYSNHLHGDLLNRNGWEDVGGQRARIEQD